MAFETSALGMSTHIHGSVGRFICGRFNPLAYLIQEPLNEDIELATDEEVAKDLAKKERAAYCRSILEVANALPATANNYSSRFTGDVKSMKKRISVLFQGGKAKRGLTVIALLLVAAVLTIGVFLRW